MRKLYPTGDRCGDRFGGFCLYAPLRDAMEMRALAQPTARLILRKKGLQTLLANERKHAIERGIDLYAGDPTVSLLLHG